MEGHELDNIRKARLWLVFINLAMLISYGAILVFTDWPIIKYYGFRIAAGFGIFYIIYHFISNYFLEKSSK